MSDPSLLSDLIEKGERASPGPWHSLVRKDTVNIYAADWVWVGECGYGFDDGDETPPKDPSTLRSIHDAAYIAACSPSVLVPLLRELEERRKDGERLDYLDAERAKWGDPPLSRSASFTFHIPSWQSFREHIDCAASRPTQEASD